MLRSIVGAFVILHGLIHLLYVGQSWRFFVLQPGLVWPDGSWAFSTLLGEGATRRLAGISCILAAIGFVAGGAGILARQAWWRPVVAGVAGFSAAIWLLFWDGKGQRLADQGSIALLINTALFLAALIAWWIDVDF